MPDRDKLIELAAKIEALTQTEVVFVSTQNGGATHVAGTGGGGGSRAWPDYTERRIDPAQELITKLVRENAADIVAALRAMVGEG